MFKYAKYSKFKFNYAVCQIDLYYARPDQIMQDLA